MRFRLVAPGLLVLSLLIPGVAAGQPADTALRDYARELVYTGDRLFAAGDYQAALTAYRSADSIMAVPTTRIEVAKTLSALGKLLAAASAAQSVLAIPRDPDEPPPFTEARLRAQRLVSELDRRIPRLTIQVAPSADQPTVTVNGAALSKLVDIPLDPGEARVAVVAGMRRANEIVILREGERRTLQMIPAAPPSDQVSTLTVASFVVGGALLTVGTVTGISAIVATDSAKESCVAKRPDCQADYDLANGLGWTANGTLVLGAVAGVVGLISLVSEPDNEQAVTLRVTPTSVHLAFSLP